MLPPNMFFRNWGNEASREEEYRQTVTHLGLVRTV